MSIQHWDGFVVVFANQVAKWPNFDLKVGNELCTQVEEANCRDWPDVGSGQSVTRSNLEETGLLH